jgi:branched-chain amino acid transport system permease protein
MITVKSILRSFRDASSIGVILFLAASLIIPFTGHELLTAILLTLLELTVLTYSINIITGFTGYVSFGHAVFYGIGAYATAVMVINFHSIGLPPYIYSIVGGAVAALFATLIGIPVLRLRGAYFAIATLSVNVAVQVAVSNIEALGGAFGLPLARYVSYDITSAYLSLWIVLCFALAFTLWLSRSEFGYCLKAIREDELVANVMGVNTTLYKTLAFVVSGFIAGIVGGIMGIIHVYVSVEYFKTDMAVKMLVSMMMGGAGTVLGPLIGSVIYYFVEYTVLTSFPYLHLLIFGAILIGIVLFIPGGIIELLGRKIGGLR